METLSSSKTQNWLSWFLRGLLILGFLVLIGRLIELQVVKGSYYRTLSEGNRIRRVSIIAPRGKIYARGGEVLVGNKEAKKRVVFDPQKGYEKINDIEGAASDEIIGEWVRDYKLGEAAAHLTGYLGEVDADEVGKIDAKCPEKGPRKLGSLLGRGGLEEMYECILSGVDGEELVEVDSLGKRVRTLGRREPVAGQNIKTSIHYRLQKKVAELMSEGKVLPRVGYQTTSGAALRGAVVVTDTRGEVLALYSSPSYDPNIFVAESDPRKITAILEDPNSPLFNRAIGGAFHPGSVFKPVVATAALEEGKIDESFTYEDTGQITIKTIYGTFTYSNWYFTQYGRTEGEIDIIRAITRSTDTFFYKTGELLGIEKINQWANKFGLAERTGIDIPGEISGLVPSPEWKERVKGERWFLGNTYHISIGQGDIALTPLGLNMAITTIASGGEWCRPQVRKAVQAEEGKCKDLEISSESIRLVKEGMKGACSSGGTGFTFFDFETPTACKTGTAETSEEGKTHAWFTAFAPVDFPEIVATVLIEKGGEGAYVAGPIAREIFNYWFTNKSP